jgi:hypothetical protein
MRQLIIEYVFEGYRRGYNFTTPTRGIDEQMVKTIWRNAMPRGQGWGGYIGASSLKCFPIGDHQLALCEVTITDQQDESGRRGIRRAVIDLMDADTCLQQLKTRLDNYPPAVLNALEKKPSLRHWKQIVERSMPKFRQETQVILARTYSTADNWQEVEALVVKIAVSCLGKARHWGRVIPFTTMALDHREELRLIAIPSQQIRASDELPVVEIV